ncbi:hypothetical protein [Agromyces sp. Leaf222]|uniref:DUF7882 family protein n=1 Tax=Agromyces sp. Leaf222 TaxID=1735688 RepID=UPI0006F2CC1D|nr:hypothetical protein [Agromyces sp. Leaf222]KQM82363.1 hypothetical protein ASE68_02925 [Agromyces sp. Leaf222]
MGMFIYDTRLEIELDDRLLAHLQIVIVDKFRRNERFAMSLLHEGRAITLWMSPQSRVQFVYAGNRRPSINPAWLDALSEVAGMSGVLRTVQEPSSRHGST